MEKETSEWNIALFDHVTLYEDCLASGDVPLSVGVGWGCTKKLYEKWYP